MHARDGRKDRRTQPQTRIVHPRAAQSQGGVAHGAVRRRRGGGAGRCGDARQLRHPPDLARGARTPIHDGLAEGLRHRGVLVLRGASRPFGRAGGCALSARAGAHTDGRESRGAVPAAAHRPSAGGIPISPPAGTQTDGWRPPGFRGPSHTNGRSSRSSPPTASPMPTRLHRRRSGAGVWC